MSNAQIGSLLVADDGQRLLFRVVLEDALEWHLAALGDCPECEWMIERGICARHRSAHAAAYRDYLGVSAYFDDVQSYRRARITAAQLRVIARALPEAISYRSGSAPADLALSAAYAELGRQLGAGAGQ